jgi:hypothetical protein
MVNRYPYNLSKESFPFPNPSCFYRMPDAAALQLVQNLRQEENVNGVSVVTAGRWLSTLEA